MDGLGGGRMPAGGSPDVQLKSRGSLGNRQWSAFSRCISILRVQTFHEPSIAMETGRQGGWVMIRQNATEQELEQLENCLGNLYEDLDAKIKATALILHLAKRMECLAAVSSHSSALCALARVLKEEGRKSFTLRTNIISIFFIFSLFKNFHQTLLGQNVGRAALQVLALEIQITESHLKPANMFSPSNKDLTVRNSEQERLLYMSISLLFNLAHNVHIEEKMKKFFLVELLCRALESLNSNLLLITVTFLKKLSIFRENIDTMKQNGIVRKLARLLPCDNELLFQTTLGLLRNLSFDPCSRTEMVESKLVQAVEAYLNHHKFESSVSALLYNLSTDKNLRLKFSETDVVSTLLKILLSEPMPGVPEEMMALVVNLTTVPSISEAICKPFMVEKLLKRAQHFGDPLLFKVIRNISQLEEAKSFLLCFVPDLVNFFLEGEPPVQVEVMGALNNMVWFEETSDVLVRKNLLQAFSTNITSIEPDILLEMCMFLGAACSARTASMISEAGLVVKLCSSFLEKREDVDLTIQFMYMFSRFLLFEPTRRDLLTFSEKMAVYVLELMRDPNKTVAKLADVLFNITMEVDHENYVLLKSVRFAMFNRLKY